MLRMAERYWHCLNRACGMTTLPGEAEEGLETRRCVCGSLMKKHSHPTVFSYLNFLREEPDAEQDDRERKEQGVCER
jgi:hypothetical protein